MFPKQMIERIRFELEQIDDFLAAYEELLDECRFKEPDLIKLTAVASVLHSFYNGVENILLQVARNIDESVPEGNQWHRDLLIQASTAMSTRIPILSPQSREFLADYMAFRHFYRHSYSFCLKWNELEKLVRQLPHVWPMVKGEIKTFLDGKHYS